MKYTGNIMADMYYEIYNQQEEKKETFYRCPECGEIYDSDGFSTDDIDKEEEVIICHYCADQIRLEETERYAELVKKGEIKSALLRRIYDCLKPVKIENHDLPF